MVTTQTNNTDSITPYSKRADFAVGFDAKQCIWYGVLCAWDAVRLAPNPESKPAFDLCVNWYGEPTEELRRMAGQWSDQKKFKSFMNAILRAIFFTGSIAPSHLKEVLGPPDTSRRMIAASLDLMIAEIPFSIQAGQYKRFDDILRQMG